MNTIVDKALALKSGELSIEAIDQYLFTSCADKISAQQKTLFIGLAMSYKLNPLKKQIYPVPFWNDDTKKMDMQPVISYTVAISKAQESKQLDWYEIEVIPSSEDKKKIDSATITIYRKDWKHPFKHTVIFDEVVGKKKDGSITNIWKNRPDFMIRKVAIGQWMRLCFPDELQWLYVEEEFSGGVQIVDASEDKKPNAVDLSKVGVVAKDPVPTKPVQEIVETIPTAEVETTEEEGAWDYEPTGDQQLDDILNPPTTPPSDTTPLPATTETKKAKKDTTKPKKWDITLPQQAKIKAIWGKKFPDDKDHKIWRAYLDFFFQFESSAYLSKKQASDVIEHLEQYNSTEILQELWLAPADQPF